MPAALKNGTTKDTQANTDVASLLLTPKWVTTENMAATVIKDGSDHRGRCCVCKRSPPPARLPESSNNA